MNGSAMLDEIYINRRSRDRAIVKLPAQYFIKNRSVRYENCIIINLSRSGAAVLFPSNAILPESALVFLEMLVPNTFDQVMLRGELKRVYAKDDILVGGIKFETVLPDKTFHKLLI